MSVELTDVLRLELERISEEMRVLEHAKTSEFKAWWAIIETEIDRRMRSFAAAAEMKLGMDVNHDYLNGKSHEDLWLKTAPTTVYEMRQVEYREASCAIGRQMEALQEHKGLLDEK